MKILARNRKAFHEYTVLDKYEAGIVLMGTEVKTLKDAKANFADSFAMVENSELFLHSLDIPPYAQGNINNHEPRRKRKLLMHSHELKKIKALLDEKGLSLVPLSIYLSDKGKIKVEIGVCRGKNLYDKRESLKRKEAMRAIRSML